MNFVQFSGEFCGAFPHAALTLKGRPNGVEVTIGSLNIRKKYTNDDRQNCVAFIRSIYAILQQKNVPNIDQLVVAYVDDHRHGSAVYLQPKGVELRPQFAIEVKEAGICILQALVVCPVILQSNFIS